MAIAIESRELQIARADQEMHQLLDRYKEMALTTRRRRPLDVDYYKWDQAQPESVHPTVIKALRFVSQVEYPPQLYAQPILQAAERDGITSLTRFINAIWLPEETQHGVVTRKAAIVYRSVSEEEHDEDLSNILQSDFTIGSGYSAGKAANYGETQELITSLFYTAMLNHTKDPVLRELLADLAAQEMFHSRGGYREFRKRFATAEDTVEGTRGFEMPGHITSPDLQQHSAGWAKELGFDFVRMRSVLATGILEQAGYGGLGRVVTSPLIRDIYPACIRVLLAIADRINNRRLNRLIGQQAAKQVLPNAQAA